jgi:transcriptional regulator
MYRPSAFAVDDIAIVHDVIRQRVFGTIASVVNGEVALVYAPVVLDASGATFGGIRFHLAVGNPLTKLKDGARVVISMMTSDAYISPDWYAEPMTVPTWNYVAVEGEGAIRRLSREALRQQIVDMSAQEEAKLLPKPPWVVEKVESQRLEALLNGIVGFELRFEQLVGKFKLSQNKTKEDFEGAIAGLEKRGDPASMAIARAMRKVSG